MKSLKIALPLLIVFALSFMLAGCPKDKMMKNDSARPGLSAMHV